MFSTVKLRPALLAVVVLTWVSSAITAEQAPFVQGSIGSLTGMGSWASESMMKSYFQKHDLPPCKVAGVLITDKGVLACEEIQVNDIVFRIGDKTIEDGEDWQQSLKNIEADKPLAVAVKRLDRSGKEPKWKTVRLELTAIPQSDVFAAINEHNAKIKAEKEAAQLADKQKRDAEQKRRKQWEEEGKFTDSPWEIKWRGFCPVHGQSGSEWETREGEGPPYTSQRCSRSKPDPENKGRTISCGLPLQWQPQYKSRNRTWPDGTRSYQSQGVP